jgi:hypothetical protein
VVQKFWTGCSSFIQKIWVGSEILDPLYSIPTENLGWFRNSGPAVFHSYRKSELVQKFWTIHTENRPVQKFWTTSISSIKKSWAGPEILDQLYFIHTENRRRSKNSGPGVFRSYRKSGLVQK